jgi:hypothetical protein
MSGDIPVGLLFTYSDPYSSVYLCFVWTLMPCHALYVHPGTFQNLIVFSASIIPSFVVYSFALTLSFTCIYTCTLQ